MIWIDYIIIVIIFLSVSVSLIRGFAREVLSVLTWACAFFVTSHFYTFIPISIARCNNELLRNAIAISILFIATLAACASGSYVIISLIERAGLSGTDKILSICFGTLRGILIVTGVLVFLNTFTDLPQSADWKKSQFVPQFNPIIRWIFSYLKGASSFFSIHTYGR